MTAIAPTTRPAAPPATAHVGMVGGGQLARMTHQAAIDLGITATTGRVTTIRLDRNWPWAAALAAAFKRLRAALPA